MTQRFFGYGSLVNRATHDYPGARPAYLAGWQRVWVQTEARPVAYLSARRAAGVRIAGLVAEVPGGDWAALDLREVAYARHLVQAHDAAGAPIAAQVYAVPDRPGAPLAPRPLLLSYLDTVLAGFEAEFGPDALAEFFATTAGWACGVWDDRAAPIYPRATPVPAGLRSRIDAALADLGVPRARP